MKHELLINDNQLSIEDTQELIFKALRYPVHGISLPLHFIPAVKEVLPSTVFLSTFIDYPLGLSDIKTKEHATLTAIRKGAKAIDLVLNVSFINNSKYGLIKQCLKLHRNICQDKGVQLRIMMEYRDLVPTKIKKLSEIMAEFNIEYIFPSTGHKLDNYADNLIAAKYIVDKYPEAKLICNGNIWTKDQYDAIFNGGVYGVRFNSIHAVRNCLSGV